MYSETQKEIGSLQNKTPKTKEEEITKIDLEDDELDSWEEDSEAKTPVPTPSAKRQTQDWDEDEDSEEVETNLHKAPKSEAKALITVEEKVKKKVKDKRRRAPVAVVLGHVDSGKTLLLDCIRGTRVQKHEAGGITQQIGATNLPIEHILSRAPKCLRKKYKEILNSECPLPGLLVIDTPGHAVFANLRERGSSLCDTAVLVVNIMEGVKITTIQCLKMLQEKKVPFVIALNQIDRLNGWKPYPQLSIKDSIKKQSKQTQQHFRIRWKKIFSEFAEQELNVALFWEGDAKREALVVPTSAFTECGVSDLLLLWSQLCTRKGLAKKLRVSEKFKCKLLEVKQVQGFGYVIDVLVTNGSLAVGDTLTLCGIHGKPIVSKIRALLIPASVQDLRANAKYRRVDEVHASCGVRVACADSLEHAVAGSRVFRFDPTPKSEKDLSEKQIEKVQAGLDAISKLTRSAEGVYLVASTLGSLEALVELLQSMQITISGFSLGTVRRKDVMKACAMIHSAPHYAVLIAFDVEIERKAMNLAEEEGLKVLHSDLYHELESDVQDHFDSIREQRRAAFASEFGLPVRLSADVCYLRRRGKSSKRCILGLTVERGTLLLETNLFVRLPLDKDETSKILSWIFRKCLKDDPWSRKFTGNMVTLIWDFLLDTTPKHMDVGHCTSIMCSQGSKLTSAEKGERVSICLTASESCELYDVFPTNNHPITLYTRRPTRFQYDLLKELFPELLQKKGNGKKN